MKISVNGRVLSVDQMGGAGQAGLSLIQALGDRGADITIYGHSAADERLDNICVDDSYFPFNSQLYGLIWEQAIFPRMVDKMTSDIVFCPTMNGPIMKIDTPVVVQVHDIFRYMGDVSRLDKLRQRLRLPRMLSCADRVVTVSEFSKSEMSEYVGVAKSKIDVVYNGVDSIFFNQGCGEELDLPEKYLLYVGGLNARKNISGLLRTFEILKTKFGLNHKLLMVGPDPKFFHNYPVDRVNNSEIKTTGFVTQAELKYIYTNADLFLFPSLYEGFGMAPLEAMACGTPVVASNRASLPEVLGNAAKLADPENPYEFAEAAIEILENQDIQRKFTSRGKKMASNYTWNQSANQLHKILKDVYSNCRGT